MGFSAQVLPPENALMSNLRSSQEAEEAGKSEPLNVDVLKEMDVPYDLLGDLCGNHGWGTGGGWGDPKAGGF